MKKYKTGIIVGAIVAFVLALAFFCGGKTTLPSPSTPDTKEAVTTEKNKESENIILSSDSSATSASSEDKIISSDAPPTQEATIGSNGETQTESTEKEPVLAKTSEPETNVKTETADKETKTESEETEKSVQTDAEEKEADNSIERETIPINLTEKATTPQKNIKTDTGESNADKYKSTRNLQGMETDGEAEGNPLPIEPGDVVISDKELTCILSVRCDTILENIALLDKEKHELVPHNGVVFAEKTVTFYDGESVFNVLLREMKRNKIHMEFENVPLYNSAYIKGIANLYEFDCGELSGWMYRVNGRTPNYGCSRYRLKDGDRVEWIYTCDLGKDIH